MNIRVFPVVITLLMLTFTVRIGDFIMDVARHGTAEVKPAHAMANTDEAAVPQEKAAADTAAKTDEKPVSTTQVKGLDADPFAPEFSSEEVKLLQSLSKRRDALEQRERDLEQREKLLQAAEKKVDEKVTELDALKTQLETLVGQQKDSQNQRIKQLVKIYENMKPKDAATIFNEMDFPVLLDLIDAMSERKVAPILAAMDPVRARDVSARLAEQRSLPGDNSANNQ